MNVVSQVFPEPPPALAEGWTIHTVGETTSTNSVASRLPEWHAVRAGTQTAGRGRTGRHWVSDAGGLWLSAVLPCPGTRSSWAILPLGAGWAVIEALRVLGVRDLRLRWPNDIMTGPRKLAGLLVERFNPDTAVVGLGLNVFNVPEQADPALAGATARLCDLISATGTIDDLARLMLRSLRRIHATLQSEGFGSIAGQLNQAWGEPRPVAVTLAGNAQPCRGFFHGIDPAGRLRLATAGAGLQTYDATQVALLRELE
jgi:BirA family biotin operon repressor/biotin-[acetyl-CoA-carboxylase] ligase